MSEWRTFTVASLAEPRGLVGGPFGSSLGSKDYVSSGVPVIRGVNLGSHGRFDAREFAYVTHEKADGELARNQALPGDVVFTQRGTLGQVGIVPYGIHDRYVISQSQMRLRVNQSLASSEYVYYWFRSSEVIASIHNHAITTGVPHINLGILGKLEVRIPSLATQNAITAVLGALDGKIAANDKIATTADSLIEASFTRAQNRDGSHMSSLASVVSFTFGAPFSSKAFGPEGSGLPLLRIRDLKTYSPQIFTSERIKGDLVVQPGDTVAGMDAEFRPTFWMGEPALLNQRVLHATSKVGGGSAFAREILRKPLAEIESYKTGTTVAHLNKSDLDRATVFCPGKSAIDEFERVAEPLRLSMVAVSQETQKLTELRDALLPKLMSGEIRVRDAEKRVGDAL